jgi:hypothetical protein
MKDKEEKISESEWLRYFKNRCMNLERDKAFYQKIIEKLMERNK